MKQYKETAKPELEKTCFYC